MPSSDPRALQTLEAHFQLPPGQLDGLLQHLEFCSLPGGQWLFHQGDPGDSLYLLLRGRLNVWLQQEGGQALDPPRLLGRVAAGESVGEIGLLTGETRSAGIQATRDSRLVRISRKSFEVLSQRHPALVLKLAARAAALVSAPKVAAAGSTQGLGAVALLPLQDTPGIREFCVQLAQQLAQHASQRDTIRVLHADNLAAQGAPVDCIDRRADIPESLVHWVQELEEQHRLVVFQCEADSSNWTRFALRQSDLVLRIAHADSDEGLRPWEPSLGLDDAHSSLRRALVLLQTDNSRPWANTHQWKSPRQLEFHLHVREGRQADVARVARVISGRSRGLVLGGGASRGFAHLGVYQALTEARMDIDWFGGSSIGGIMGALMAKGLSPEECIESARESFVGHRPFSDYTLPVVSLIAGRRMQRELRRKADMAIEDLALPFFCVSSNLDNGHLNLHDHGLLSRALQASASMPGVFPPTVFERQLAVDGTVLNSLPVDIMWQQPVGEVLAVDLAVHQSRTVDYDETPSAWAVLGGRLLPFTRRYRVPPLMSVLMKSNELATLQQVRAQGRSASLLLQPDVRRFGLTQVNAFDRIVEAGYRCASAALDGWQPPNQS